MKDLLEDVFRPTVAAAMEKYGQGEDITWTVGLMAFPNPQTQGNFISMLVIYMQMPSPVVGMVITNTALVEPQLPSTNHEDIVRQLIEATLNSRSQQLAAQVPAGAPQGPGSGSLLTP